MLKQVDVYYNGWGEHWLMMRISQRKKRMRRYHAYAMLLANLAISQMNIILIELRPRH